MNFGLSECKKLAKIIHLLYGCLLIQSWHCPDLPFNPSIFPIVMSFDAWNESELGIVNLRAMEVEDIYYLGHNVNKKWCVKKLETTT